MAMNSFLLLFGKRDNERIPHAVGLLVDGLLRRWVCQPLASTPEGGAVSGVAFYAEMIKARVILPEPEPGLAFARVSGQVRQAQPAGRPGLRP